jgi:hypothetical protein
LQKSFVDWVGMIGEWISSCQGRLFPGHGPGKVA